MKIIRSLNQNIAQFHDDNSIWFAQNLWCRLVKPLSSILKNCFQYGLFPNLWKKANIFPAHMKRDKQYMVNYCPVPHFLTSIQISNIIYYLFHNVILKELHNAKYLVSTIMKFVVKLIKWHNFFKEN